MNINEAPAVVYQVAFSRHLNALVKQASHTKQAFPGGSLLRMGQRLLTNGGESAAGRMLGEGAMGGIEQRLLTNGGESAAAGAGNMFSRFAPHLNKAKAWMQANPGTTGAIGGAAGGFGAAKGYDSMRDSGRRNAVANQPFGDRLMFALKYLTDPQGTANRLY